MRGSIVVVLVAASAVLLPSCGTREFSMSDLGALTEEIQGKNPDEVRSLIIQRFGPSARDIGSGLQIEQWDCCGGVLTFHPLTGPTFAKGESVTRLMRTNNSLESCLFGKYEMTTLPDLANRGTCYWLGNVSLSSDLKYQYVGSGQHHAHRAALVGNYFLAYPEGSVQVQYAPGLTPRSRLEDVPDGTLVATLLFKASGDFASRTYIIVTDRTSMRLAFRGEEPLTFQMDKSWESHWR